MGNNEERIHELMIAALDDELDDVGSAELNHHLADHPDLAAEWNGILFIDNLLSDAPPMLAPVNFAERTLAQLPNPRYRRIFLACLFGILLILGLVPVLGGIYAYGQFDGGAFVGDFALNLAQYFSFIRVASSAILSGLSAVAVNQPWAFAWVFLMIAVIFAWQNFYGYLTTPMRSLPAR